MEETGFWVVTLTHGFFGVNLTFICWKFTSTLELNLSVGAKTLGLVVVRLTIALQILSVRHTFLEETPDHLSSNFREISSI